MANYPTTIGFSTADFVSVDRTLSDETHSGKLNVRKVHAQHYACTLQYNKLTPSEVGEIMGFVEGLRGQFTAFDIVLPILSSRRGAGSAGTPVVLGASQTGTTLTIDGAPALQSGWMAAGDFFRLAGHNKVYRSTTSVNTNSFGEATIILAQPLMESPANNEALTIDAVPFSMRLANNVQKYALSKPDFYMLEADMRENL